MAGKIIARSRSSSDLAGERVDGEDALHLVAEHLDAGDQLLVHRVDLQHVAAHAEVPAGQGDVVALELHVHQPAQQPVAVVALAPLAR